MRNIEDNFKEISSDVYEKSLRLDENCKSKRRKVKSNEIYSKLLNEPDFPPTKVNNSNEKEFIDNFYFGFSNSSKISLPSTVVNKESIKAEQNSRLKSLHESDIRYRENENLELNTVIKNPILENGDCRPKALIKNLKQYNRHAIKSDENISVIKPRIPGVRFDTVGHRWVASWSSGGRQIQKYFPVKKFGNNHARDMAIFVREQAILKEHSAKENDKIDNFDFNKFSSIENDLYNEEKVLVDQKVHNEQKISENLNNKNTNQDQHNHILDKSLFVLVPEHSILVSLPATIHRVPISEENANGNLETSKYIEIISLNTIADKSLPSPTHIDPKIVRLATDLAQRVSDSLNEKQNSS